MYDVFRKKASEIIEQIDLKPGLKPLLEACFLFTLDDILDIDAINHELRSQGTAFVKTGDIPAMWLRDSAAQIRPYVPFAKDDPDLAMMIKGVIRRQGQSIMLDPYANAFNASPDDPPFEPDDKPMIPGVWERKYELDSLCYPLQLCQDYWKATGDSSIFDDEWRQVVQIVLDTMQIEQHHVRDSSYYFERKTTNPLENLRGHPANYTGMVWSGFRPSDDSCEYNYLVPANMFAAVVLSHVMEWTQHHFDNADAMFQQASQLRADIQSGIEEYAIVEHEHFGKLYAYEVDGYGNYNLMDDANIPSLLAMPYLGFCSQDDAIYRNTRQFVLTPGESGGNPFCYHGTKASGVGSPHTPKDHVWHLGLVMQALTTNDVTEQDVIIQNIIRTASARNLMHESVHKDHFDPLNEETYTREEFGWANSLFAQLILDVYKYRG